MSDNPFGRETQIRPSPGGRSWGPATPPPERMARPVGPGHASGTGTLDVPPTGASPLLLAAAPLLQLLARLNVLTVAPDTDGLRQSVVKALGPFQTAALQARFPETTVRTAHYALCASLDDVVMNAPWGRTSRWKDNSLVAEYHGNVGAGEGFFREIEQLQRDPAQHLPLLELMYYCLSLGFMGRYRPSLGAVGAGQHEAIRTGLFDILRRFQPSGETELSPHWRGTDAPYRPARAVLPAWVIASFVALCLVGAFLFLSGLLNRSGDAVLAAADRTVLPVPVVQRTATPQPYVQPLPQLQLTQRSDTAEQLHRFLGREIDEGLVKVQESPATIRVQIRSSGMFPSGSATINPDFLPLLRRIGDALNAEAGRVQIIGHTDNQPIRTVRFQSNRDLSAARADAARAIIAAEVSDPQRLRSEGHADLEPIQSNDTPAGREANRRIEIILQRQG